MTSQESILLFSCPKPRRGPGRVSGTTYVPLLVCDLVEWKEARGRIHPLPSDTECHPGHDEPLAMPQWPAVFVVCEHESWWSIGPLHAR